MSVLNTGLQLEITIDNVVTFVTALSPIILTIFFLLNSALNFDIRGFLWLLGLLVTEMIRLALRAMLEHEKPSKYANINFCSFLKIHSVLHGHYTIPSFHGTFHGYTISYLLYGIMNNPKYPAFHLSVHWYSLHYWISYIDLRMAVKIGCRSLLVYYMVLLWVSSRYCCIRCIWKGKSSQRLYFGKQDKLKQCSLDNKKYSCKVKKKVTI